MVASLSRRAEAERCFPCHSPTLQPWIGDRRAAHIHRGRRPSWGGVGARASRTGSEIGRIKQTLIASVYFQRAAPKVFLSQAGPRFDPRAVQAEHHLRSDVDDRPRTRKRRPGWVALVWFGMRLESSAHTSQRGHGRSRAGASGRSYAGTARPSRLTSLRPGILWCWDWSAWLRWLFPHRRIDQTSAKRKPSKRRSNDREC